MPFRPKVGTVIVVNEVNRSSITFTEHPAAKGMPYGQQGRKATVYKVQDDQGYCHALKVFLKSFRQPQNARGAVYLGSYAAMPGLNVCYRLVLTPETQPTLLGMYPDLLYAVLMPWVEGKTWHDYLAEEQPITPEQSHELASNFSYVLLQMENAGLAHCDLSAPNVIITESDRGLGISLVDVEDMYGPGFERPTLMPAGTSGYGHKTASQGIWCVAGDRFAGAVLLAEMLGWCDERVRRIKYDEAFFDPSELQKSSERCQVLMRVLRERWGERVSQLFSQAWHSQTLEDCPPFSKWWQAINTGPGPSPEELRKEIEKLMQSGDLSHVPQLCDDLIALEGQPADALRWKAQALKIIELRQNVADLCTKATASGATQDWQACIAAQKALAEQDTNHPVDHQQLVMAQNELEAALMLDQVEMYAARGLLRDAQALLSQTSTQSPRRDPLKAGVDLRIQQENEARQLLKSAYQLLGKGEWEQVITVCQNGLALGVEKGEFQKMLEQARSLKDRSQEIVQGVNQIRSFFEQREWQQALDSADRLAFEHPEEKSVLKLRETARQNVRYAAKLTEAKALVARDEYHAALSALQAVPDKFPEAGDLRVKVMESLSLQDRLHEARSAFDPVEVLSLLEKASTGSGQTGNLRQWAEEEIRLIDALSDAQATYNFDRVSDLLNQLPADHPRRGPVQVWLSDQQTLRERIAQARASYNDDEVRRLILSTPDEYPQREELLTWVERECDRKAHLASARALFQWQTVLDITAGLPEDYPERASHRKWAEAVREQHKQIEYARAGYNLTELEAQCEALLDGDPVRGESRAWLVRERNRMRQVEAAGATKNAAALLDLLRDAPAAFPGLKEKIAWAEAEVARQEAVRSVMQTMDLDGAEELLAQFPSDSKERAALAEWLDKEKVRAEKIRVAQLGYKYNEVLQLISAADGSSQRIQEARQWAEGWLQAEETIEQAIANEDLAVLEAYLEQLPSDHPRTRQIRKLKEEVQSRVDSLKRLQTEANQALSEGRYDMVINLCRQGLLIPGAGVAFKEMLASAENGLARTRQTNQALQQVRGILEQGQFEQALTLCRASLEQDPHNEEARSLFLRIREAIEFQAKKFDQTKNWKASSLLWKLLVDKSQLPEGVRPVQRPDPFDRNAAAGERRARIMRRNEGQRIMIIALAIILAVIIVGGLIYLITSGAFARSAPSFNEAIVHQIVRSVAIG